MFITYLSLELFIKLLDLGFDRVCLNFDLVCFAHGLPKFRACFPVRQENRVVGPIGLEVVNPFDDFFFC